VLSNGRFTGFRSHPKLEGSHAILSASNYHWLNYTEDRLIERLRTAEAAALGTRLHAWAAEAISLGRLQPNDGDVLSAYINDALEYGMIPEQLLFHSMNAYGTADTIGFEEYLDHEQYAGFLRIHDFKSGVSKTSEDQLYIYAGFFCLEYDFRPFEIDGELRIYQGEEVRIYELDRGYLARVYDKIRTSNIIIEQRRMGGLV
jgi:hypothetical protein